MLVLQMKPTEHVSVDHDRLGALYSQLGEAGAEDIVCRALEEMALRLTHCTEMYHNENWPSLRKSARSLIAIGDQIGMQVLTRVAADVTKCIDAGDKTALAATLSRLIRVGERSLTMVWDTHETPI
tara:strand:- start:135 stop:512 length:378 start_codon:yes stop_codon:yes gene_type:complete